MTSPTLREALEAIADWKLPATGKCWRNTDGTMSNRPIGYEAEYGSNGARDYIRNIARTALAADDATPSHEAGRRAGLEEAARVADVAIDRFVDEGEGGGREWAALSSVAAAIRNLAGDEGIGDG